MDQITGLLGNPNIHPAGKGDITLHIEKTLACHMNGNKRCGTCRLNGEAGAFQVQFVRYSCTEIVFIVPHMFDACGGADQGTMDMRVGQKITVHDTA